MEFNDYSLLHNSIEENSFDAIKIIREAMTDEHFKEIVDVE